MEFAFGILVGIVLTLIVIGVVVSVALRRSSNAPLPELPRFDNEPAVTVMMVEPFLNHQLREALADADLQSKSASETRDATHTASENGSGQKASRFKINLTGATLDVQTGQRAKFHALLTATAWNFSVPLHPIAELQFVITEGRVKIFVTDVQVGGFHVPRALVDRFVSQVVSAAEAKLNHTLLQFEHDTQLILSAIETTEELMVLKFAEPGKVAVPAIQGVVK